MSSQKDSRALRFYSDVLGLEHLHYGLWQAGEETSLANLKAAQARYQQAIMIYCRRQQHVFMLSASGASS
jgi:hypothetical protein